MKPVDSISPELRLEASIRDKASPWFFSPWYFEFRIDEEIERCKRYAFPLAIVVLSLKGKRSRSKRSQLSLRLASSVRPFDIAAVLGDWEYGFCLVQCDREGAETVTRRLLRACEECGWPATAGIAAFPGDARSAKFLVHNAGKSTASPLPDPGMPD
jgi:hypothetical protein